MPVKKELALFVWFVFLHLSLAVCGQGSAGLSDPLITLSEKNAPLEKILKIIQQQAGITYFISQEDLAQAKPVTINVKNATIGQVLYTCFKEQPFEYRLDDKILNIRIKEAPAPRVITGKVINSKGEPVPSATIQLKGGTGHSLSNDSGVFSIRVTDPDGVLIVSSINSGKEEYQLAGRKEVTVQLKERFGDLTDVVIVNNGYQRIPRERATGSFATVNRELIDRRVSNNILDRIDGVTSSVLFNKNSVLQTNTSTITIRGRSTIFANPEPLIVIDNFPYSGSIYNINPEDVESVTILKDAAASSIWGALAGNGVIVITTRQGKKQEPKIGFTTSLGFSGKPNMNYLPILSSNDYINVERQLFDSSFYVSFENDPAHRALSPVVELLIRERDGLISVPDAENQINALRGQDTRRDLDKYFYRRALNQQYFLNLTGGTTRNQYYLSAGFDKDLASLVRNQYNRVTLHGNNTYIIVPNRLELNTGFDFSSSITQNKNNGSIGPVYPYLKLAGANGQALIVPGAFRQTYIDTAGAGQLLDWNYRPLDDLHNADNSTHLTDYRVNIGIKYLMGRGLEGHAYYQHGHGIGDMQNFQSQATYFTRNWINQYTQITPAGSIRAIPLGGILDKFDTGYTTNNVRVQLNYDHRVGQDGVLSAIGGAELMDVEGQVNDNRLYGYNKEQQSSIPVNYLNSYPLFMGGSAKIPYNDVAIGTSDHYLSYYFNGSYNYLQRYILSASARKDESNIFGVKANNKGVPLWSVGAAWEISREEFYRWKAFPYLNLRLTDGYNGNTDKSLSAFTTSTLNPDFNGYGAITASITNPPNPSLRWEQIHILNLGVDFAARNDRVKGTLEYYIKNGIDLIGQSKLDPTTGNIEFQGNSAAMKAHGVDLILNTKNIIGKFSWNTNFLFSYTKDKVTNYPDSQRNISNYLTQLVISPLAGRPLYSIYALRWMGLDPQTGDPQGLLNGKISKDYVNLFTSSDFGSLLYKGTANPTFFGSLRNSFAWKQFGVSFNIIYKFGYYFRRSSIDYYNLFDGGSPGHPDYDKRWQNPGDEKRTNVPSMIIPGNQVRDEFYTYSEALIEKGDHIRLQDIRLSYDMPKKNFSKLPVQTMEFFLYANNIGILWKANHAGVDPDNITAIPNPRTLAAGIKMDL